MGYELRRQLRELLGPDIVGVPRAVALEIADDARHETRVSWASLEDLARWTAAKNTDVVRDALKRLAAAGWEFRVPIGKGADGRLLYAVPGKRLTFRVPDFDDREDPEQGRVLTRPSTQGRVTTPSEGVTTPSEGVQTPSEGAGTRPLSSPPHDPSSLSTPLGLVRAAGAVADGEERELIEFIEKNNKIQGLGWWIAVCGNGTIHTHAAKWRETKASQPPPRPPLPDWCGECGVDTGNHPDAVRKNPRLRYRGGNRKCPDCHPDTQPGPG